MFVFLGPVGHRNKILRNVKDVKRKEIEDSIPDEFLCPITRELMSDPVIAAGTIIVVSLFSPYNARFLIIILFIPPAHAVFFRKQSNITAAYNYVIKIRKEEVPQIMFRPNPHAKAVLICSGSKPDH